MPVILLMSGISSRAQDLGDPEQLLKKYQTSPNDTNKVQVCLSLGSFYMFKDEKFDTDLDSAYIFLNEAQSLADKLKAENLGNAAMALTGNYYVLKGDVKRGTSLSKKAIDYFHSNKNFLQEALTWKQLGNSIADTNAHYAQQKLHNYDNARLLFIQLNQPAQTAETLEQIALCNARQKKIDTAEHIMRQAIEIYKSINSDKTLDAYNTLAEISEYQSDLHRQLMYRIELVKLMETTGDTANAASYYAKLALAYAHVSMYSESLVMIKKAIDLLKRDKLYDDFYGDLSLAIFDYIELGKADSALVYLLKTTKEVPPQHLAHEVDLNDMLGKCYAAMKQYAKAEGHYLRMMKLFESTQTNLFYSKPEQMTIDFIHYNQVIGNYYITTGEYKKAGVYFGKILNLKNGNIRPITLSKVHLMQFKVDSASHNYVAAIRHYQRYKEIQDSLFNVARAQQIQELNIKYETEKQTQDLQLKQQSIAALTSQTRAQQADLRRAGLTRNIIIASSILLLALAYIGYRIKLRHNLQLQVQQQEINTRNTRLRELLTAQEQLVVEKEWLLKEIHHRVKNNLQIVISLLNTQSKYLDNTEAIKAIAESRHRMQAMSLIHQKLYQSENTTFVNMHDYISELTKYLQESFDNGKPIDFNLNIDQIELDIAEAIPLGFILNETITNAIKYGFRNKEKGCIAITMRITNAKRIFLEIADNGDGLPDHFDITKSTSMGMRLITGLVKQINGQLHITNKNGVSIQISFDTNTRLKSMEAEPERAKTAVIYE